MTEDEGGRVDGRSIYVFGAGHMVRRARPEGARKLSPGFTLGKSI
jgi:hypothetical protein